MDRRMMVFVRRRNARRGGPTTGISLRVSLKWRFIRKYLGLARRWVRYRAIAPTFLEMDILLSFRMTIRLFREAMLFIPS